MKFRVILCLALLVLIALGGLNEVLAKQTRPSTGSKWANTWQGDCAKTTVWVLIGPMITSLPIYIVSLPLPADEPLGQKRGIPKGYKGKKGKEHVGADKNLRIRGQGEAIQH